MSRFARKGKPPAGFEYIAPTLEILEQELRDKVNEPHEGKRRVESTWAVHQINWQRSRYVYEMYWKYGKISREVLDYCIRNKLVDGGLCAKWRKPGYERLCSTYVINTRNYNFGTVSICRVPRQSLGEGTVVECPTTGCRGCASGPAGYRNIFGNKYGQSLARIQVARETKAAQKELEEEADDSDDEAPQDDATKASLKKRRREEDGAFDVVGRPAKGSSAGRIWAADDEQGDDDDDEEKQADAPPVLQKDDDDGPIPPKQARAATDDAAGASVFVKYT